MQETNSLKPVLSISLLSSGRKETIWKCLDSLKPIQEALTTELIIVDTGCDEETHEKMKEYTDKVIKFTWCNDFSKARNVGLKESKGEWFLYIDDDEWFTDVTEMIEFFQSGEYKEYGYANYLQRNYTSENGRVYRDAWVSRMIRLDKDTRFESSIHEYLYPIKGKLKLLHCPADHYGYIFKNDKDKYAHSKRNVTLLIDMIEKERGNLRWWIQLAQEYLGIRELYKLEELCKEGIEEFKRLNAAAVNRNRATFYVGLVSLEMQRSDYEKAKEHYLTFIQDQRNTDLCKAKLYSLGAEIYYKLKDYKACEELCKEYLKIYPSLEGDELKLISQGSFFLEQVLEEGNRNNIYGFYIKSALERKNTSVLKEYFYKINWEANELRIYSETPMDIVGGIAALPFEEEFVDIVEKMMGRRGVEPRIIKYIRELEKEDEEKFKNLCSIFSKINSQNHYVLYMKLHHANNTSNSDGLEEIYRLLFGRVINLWDLEDFIFEIAEEFNIDFESIIFKIKFDNWKKGVDLLFKKSTQEKITIRKNFLKAIMSSEDLRYDYFFMKDSEASLRHLAKEQIKSEKKEEKAQEGILNEEYSDTLEENFDVIYVSLKDFTNRYLNFYQKFFKETAFEGEMELLPPECRLAAKLEKVFEEERQGNIRAMTEALELCFHTYPVLDPLLKIFAKGKKEEVKEAVENRKELLSLGEQIKTQIFVLLENRMYAEANNILSQLKNLLPEDLEIVQLEERVREGLS